jgi:alkylated DNA repair dioxygenase AlkB
MDPGVPQGFVYRPDFISADEEQEFLRKIAGLEFSPVVMHGIAARRRVIHFGFRYAFSSQTLSEGTPIPEFLLPLRERSAGLIDAEPRELSEALITEYPAGAVIGWHRDAPIFGRIIGISLLSSCRMRLRRLGESARNSINIELAPRSAYVIRGAARASWQHHIPAVKAQRYSITFRTLRHPNSKHTEPRP